MTGSDLTLPVDDGVLNVRVGAVILRDGKFLMVGNRRAPYLYSVGGRIRFGETAEQAIRREVFEETGVSMEVERLGFVHENFFYSDAGKTRGKLYYEISLFFYMKVPADFCPSSGSAASDRSTAFDRSTASDGSGEFLEWISPDEERTFYPSFFRTELRNPSPDVRHIVTDDRAESARRIGISEKADG